MRVQEGILNMYLSLLLCKGGWMQWECAKGRVRGMKASVGKEIRRYIREDTRRVDRHEGEQLEGGVEITVGLRY